MSTAPATSAPVDARTWASPKRVIYVSTGRAVQVLASYGVSYTRQRIRQMILEGKVRVEIDGAEYGPHRATPTGKWQVPLEWVKSLRPKPPIRR